MSSIIKPLKYLKIKNNKKMKIQRARFFNFKNVPNLEKEINGANVILLAENTFGKSNFIKGIQAALAGTVGKHAIREGEQKAEVEVVLSEYDGNGSAVDGTAYSFLMKVKRDKEGDEKVVLQVTYPNGLVETKKTTIGTVAGEVELEYDFVELSKTAAGKKRQLEIVKSFLPEETKEALRVWESRAASAYTDRTDIGKDVKSKEGYIAEMGMVFSDIEKYKKVIDVAEFNKKIAEASQINTDISDAEVRMKNRIERNIEIEEELKRLQEELNVNNSKNALAKDYLLKNKKINIEVVQQELAVANEHNAKCEKVKSYEKALKELHEAKEQYGEYTALIESSRQAISDTIREMEFPIEGISFDDDNVYYHGKMVDEATLSTAEIMMLEVELLMSRAKGAEVVFIQRGESLGLPFLKLLQQKAEQRGYQLVMEQVERGTEELRIELMPDYI